VTPETAVACREAGVDVLVSASSIFGSENYRSEIDAIRGEIATAPGATRA